MKNYDHKKIEKKWQKEWEKKKVYQASNKSKKPKFYSLIEFPYPSGDGLHVGHPRPYIGMDVISRKKRMEGFNVLYPIGWDAFGLPTENYAIKTGLDPRVVTKKNSDNFRRQIQSIGISFDWSREVNTTDPKYYKWTQWIFLQFFKKGLAYKKKMMINWCPKDKIGLANEEVVSGACERCGTQVEKREKEQWMLAITKYADRLDKDLDTVDYLPQIKLAQRNWIGRSEGAEIEFSCFASSDFSSLRTAKPNSSLVKTRGSYTNIKVFTTRPDTIFGATFIAVAPEVAREITGRDFGIKVDTDRENKEKIGIDTGLKAKNPASGEMMPVFAVNYVSADYGTGAIMGVPAHDERDFEFAKKYNLPIKQVIEPLFISTSGNDAIHKDLPFIEREAISVIVKHWSLDKYLCLKWKKVDWGTFVTGGVEKGQSPEQAARAEIEQETGYFNLKLVKEFGSFHSKFFHVPKNVNRFAHLHCLYFELENGEQKETTNEEKEKHEVLWIEEKNIINFLTPEGQRHQWGIFKREEGIYTGEGILINSGQFSGLDSEKAKSEIVKFVDGKGKITFKLRDWVFSRQRYWGEPIPVVHCEKCGIVPLPEKDLPLELPKVKNYQPTDSGESPLANISKWVNTKCPKCKGKAKRETDTMPNWAGSSWYYLRYTDPKNKKAFADNKNLKYWTPVDWYNGGNEHTTLHLLYSRFWHKFLFDLKLVPTPEPYMKRTSHGLILGEGGIKMSKSLGNVINPDDIVNRFGADTLRLYEMFMGPFDQKIAWSEEAIVGPRRFLEKVWKIGFKALEEENSVSRKSHPVLREGSSAQNFSASVPNKINKLLHKTIKKVSEDIESMHFNTAISAMMILATEMEKGDKIELEDYKKFLQILAPFAPHITEEFWRILGKKTTISLSAWPLWDESLILDEELKIVVQVNGKVRGEILISSNISEEEIKQKVLMNQVILKHIGGREVKKIIYIKNRLINIVL